MGVAVAVGIQVTAQHAAVLCVCVCGCWQVMLIWHLSVTWCTSSLFVCKTILLTAPVGVVVECLTCFNM